MRKRCRRRGCTEFVRVGQSYCPRHRPYGGNWAYLREQILRRDNYRCRCSGCSSCGPDAGGPCVRDASTVDHKNGDPLDNRAENLDSMCRPCNTAKGGIA